MWWSLADDEHLPFLRNKIKRDYEALRSSIWLLANSGCISDDQSVFALQKIFALEKLVYDDAVTPDGWGAAKLQVDIAKLYARRGDDSKVIEHLNNAAAAAESFDNRPDEQSFSSVLLGDVDVKRIDFETADARTLCEIMRDKWLSSPEFDRLRGSDAFKGIINVLC